MIAFVNVWKYELHNIITCIGTHVGLRVLKCNCLGEIHMYRPTGANKGDGNKLLF